MSMSEPLARMAGPHGRPLTAEEIAKQKSARLMLKVVIAVVALALTLTILAQQTGVGVSRTDLGSPVTERIITIESGRPGDGVTIRDQVTGETLLAYEPGRGAFFYSVARAFSMKRRTGDVPASAPYVITHWSSGRLTLSDPATGHRVPVDAFSRSLRDLFAGFVGAETTQQ